MKDPHLLEEAITRLAALFEHGELQAASFPAGFINTAAEEIERLREALAAGVHEVEQLQAENRDLERLHAMDREEVAGLLAAADADALMLTQVGRERDEAMAAERFMADQSAAECTQRLAVEAERDEARRLETKAQDYYRLEQKARERSNAERDNLASKLEAERVRREKYENDTALAREAAVKVAEFSATMIGHACETHKEQMGRLSYEVFVARHGPPNFACCYCLREVFEALGHAFIAVGGAPAHLAALRAQLGLL